VPTTVTPGRFPPPWSVATNRRRISHRISTGLGIGVFPQPPKTSLGDNRSGDGIAPASIGFLAGQSHIALLK
jgi:hypothetical protein